MKRLREGGASIVMALMLVFALTPVAFAESVNPVDSIQKGVDASGGSSTKGSDGLKGSLKNIVDILLFILGAIAVIMVVVGGLRYVLSGGDSNQITAAKNTILYAIVGVVVAILAYAIVHWVIDQF